VCRSCYEARRRSVSRPAGTRRYRSSRLRTIPTLANYGHGRSDAWRHAKQGLRPADPLKGSHDVQRERDESVMIDVRQLAFRLRPDEFIGIEFRRVARQAVGLDTGRAAEKGLDVPTPMNVPAVPQQDNLPSERTEQLAEKRDDLGARGAIRAASTAQWPPCRAGAYVAPASANSTPGHGATAPRRRRGCSCQWPPKESHPGSPIWSQCGDVTGSLACGLAPVLRPQSLAARVRRLATCCLVCSARKLGPMISTK
jgi:hypothetical protein